MDFLNKSDPLFETRPSHVQTGGISLTTLAASILIIFASSLILYWSLAQSKDNKARPVESAQTDSVEVSLTVDKDDTQAQALRASLVGVWELVSYQITLEGPVKVSRYPLGSKARGLIIYTSDGHLSVQIMEPGVAPFRSEIPHAGSKEEKSRAAGHYMAYGGKFRVGRMPDQTLVIEHGIEHSLFPNWIGQKQMRVPDLNGDRLTLKPLTLPTFLGMKADASLTWKKCA